MSSICLAPAGAVAQSQERSPVQGESLDLKRKKNIFEKKKFLLKSIGIILGKNYPGRKVKFKTIFLIDKKIFLKHFCQEMEKGNKSVFALNVKVIGLSWYAIFESTAENNTWSEF